MKLKTSVSLMVALVLAVVTTKVGVDTLRGYRTTGSGASVSVVTAKRDLQPGQVIEATDVSVTEVSPKFAPAKAVKDISEVIGRTVSKDIIGGQPILDGMLAPKGSGIGWQALVPPGMRAVTVDVSDSSAVAGMLIPGCKVDVITTLRRGDQTIAKAIAQNVEVKYLQRARSGYSSKNGQSTPIENGPVKTVTLIVTPKQASAIELANSSGSRPRLVLRGNSDVEAGDGGMISSRELMGLPEEPPASAPLAEPPPVADVFEPEPQDAGKTVQILRGSQEETKTFFEDKDEASGNGTVEKSAADKSKPSSGEPRTASGQTPPAPRRTEVRSISR